MVKAQTLELRRLSIEDMQNSRLTGSGKRATKPPRRISAQNFTYAPRITPHTSHTAFHIYFVFHITFTFHIPYSLCMPRSYSTLVPHTSLDKDLIHISCSILHIHFIHHIFHVCFVFNLYSTPLYT